MPLFGEAKKQYQREWMAARRAEGIAYLGGKCVSCGSKKDLQIDHKDSKKKISHRIWSWAEPKRKAELDKCQLLCIDCHKKKTKENEEALRGSKLKQSKLDEEKVVKIRLLHAEGTSMSKLAKQFGVDKMQISRVVNKRTWKHVK